MFVIIYLCSSGINKAFTLSIFFSQIYFRIHVSVLKLLFDKYPDVDVGVLEEHLQRASQGPFYHAEFDTEAGQGTVYRSESTTSGVCNTIIGSYQTHTVLLVKEGTRRAVMSRYIRECSLNFFFQVGMEIVGRSRVRGSCFINPRNCWKTV